MARRLAGLSRPSWPSWRSLLWPVRVDWPRAAAEGVVGYALIIVVMILADPGYQPSGRASILSLLASFWLVCWPAWRLRQAQGRHVWSRWAKGCGRALLCGAILGVSGSLLDALLWPPLSKLAHGDGTFWLGNAFQILILFLGARLVVSTAAALRRRLRRRLLWQLTASHFAVIIVTFVAMTGVASVIASQLLIVALRSNPHEAATSLAGILQVAGAAVPTERHRAQLILDEVEAGRLPLRGEPPLAVLAPQHIVPVRVLLIGMDGKILAAAMSRGMARTIGLARAAAPLPAAAWQRLHRAALAGRADQVPQRVLVRFNSVQMLPGQTTYAAAPILDAAGHPVAVAVAQVPMLDSLFTPSQLLASTFGVFGVAAVVLILVTSLPLLGLSTLFGYLLARGLTRRLEALSRVTTAIAAGDLTQRAPVISANEVGQLAQDVNRMAAHLETTMDELRRARTAAEEALKARQELVASISHELRTPLAIVRAHLDTLTMRQATAAGRQGTWDGDGDVTVPETTLHALQNETERLAALVDDLFTLSRAETGALQVYTRPVDVAALVDDVAALMRPLAQSEGMIALSVEAPPGLPPALADADRLRQILENLVRNAVRHTPDGGIIVLSVAQQDSWIVVSVADTGEGIPPEHLPHIFERFYRVDQARARSSGGAGLGLALVREFVELMGGRVTVESTVGEGSCFQVYLPLAAAPDPTTRPLTTATSDR